MVFNSLAYAVFLPLVLAAYFCLGLRGQNRMLLVASYLFYGWWDERFLFLVILSTGLDYVCSLLIERGTLTRKQRFLASTHLVSGAFLFLVLDWNAFDFLPRAPFVHLDTARLLVEGPLGRPAFYGVVAFVLASNLVLPWLARLPDGARRRVGVTLSVVGNLGLLGFFKYFDFFISSAEAAASSLGFDPHFVRLDVLLPVGISFYTFQTMSYTLDVYRGDAKATDRYGDFALYVTYFPQLVAGPIERAVDLIPRLSSPRRFRLEDIAGGTYLILLGLFKKVAIADGVGKAIGSVFNSASPSWLEVTAASSLFCVQVYGDFSGYSDIARGSSKLLGIPLMVNFRLPFFAASPTEFFQRWHISLSTWLRDYVYLPLGGNRGGAFKSNRNLFLTMLLGGLWHGAAWTFVVWGAYEGVLIVIDRLIRRGKKVVSAEGKGLLALVRRLPWIASYFVVHLFSWMTFRAGTWERFKTMCGAFAGNFGNLRLDIHAPTASAVLGIPLLLLLETVDYTTGKQDSVRTGPLALKAFAYAAMILLIVMGTSNDSKQFIYFQF